MSTVCDTPATIDVKRGDTCERCWQEYEDWEPGDPELLTPRNPAHCLLACHQCGIFHLRKNMSEKIPGHLCMACCAEYEENLLRKLVASD